MPPPLRALVVLPLRKRVNENTSCLSLGRTRGTRRAATSTDYGGPVARRRRAEDGEAEQTRRARRGREQDFAEISRRMYEEIRSSRDPRDHVEDG